jgi:formyltetrahydrofolate synthetase
MEKEVDGKDWGVGGILATIAEMSTGAGMFFTISGASWGGGYSNWLLRMSKIGLHFLMLIDFFYATYV